MPINVFEQELMNAIEKRAETAGKTVVPIIVSSNDALHAIMQTVQAIEAQELLMGVSERFTVNEQLDHCSQYWAQLNDGNPPPLTIRIVGQNRDFYSDISGGNRIPRARKRGSLSSDDLQAIGTAVDRVLFLHDGTPHSIDLFRMMLTALDRGVGMDVIQLCPERDRHFDTDVQAAQKAGRKIKVIEFPKGADQSTEFVRIIREDGIDIVIASVSLVTLSQGTNKVLAPWADDVIRNTDCRVFFAADPPELGSKQGDVKLIES